MAQSSLDDDIAYRRSLVEAIQSLDLLNDQIVEFIFSPKQKSCDFEAQDYDDCMRHPKQREALKSSMALMRRLLMDAQAKFRKMVEDNKQLASRIDGDLHMAHEEVNTLRAELVDTNRRINQLSTGPFLAIGSDVDDHCAKMTTRSPPSDGDRCLNGAYYQEADISPSSEADKDQVSQLKCQNEMLGQRNRNLEKEVEELKAGNVKEGSKEQRPRLEKVEADLLQAKEALAALKADRKRLKAEKFDLLNQMKQLYSTLEDKEKELRDFIRNYEQRMKDSDESLKQLVAERDETEREKWSILKHARDETERSAALSAQLSFKEAQLKQMHDELMEARRQLSQLGYYSDHDSQGSGGKANGFHTPTPTGALLNGRDTSGMIGGGASSSDTTSQEGTIRSPAITVDSADADTCSIYATASVCGAQDGTNSLHVHHTGLSRSAEELTHVLSTLDLKKKPTYRRPNSSKGTWGSISRVFSRSRCRRSVDAAGLVRGDAPVDKRTSWSPHNSLCASPLTEETYSEKLRLLEEAQCIPLERWKASTVLAWLEVSLGMPQYGAFCAENVKSGKVLLELSDAELEIGLGISNPMHRRKLRLAIEEFRDPSSNKFPRIAELTHVWVCTEWLPGLGLSQHGEIFSLQLVDGRVLDQITKKDLDKFLGVTRKFHQVSLMHGIQMLRMVSYDLQVLAERRSVCEHMDTDPIVWTNQRCIKWARSIDLAEYADNLKDSGVHGALVVLEPSFTADTMATALGVPQSKNIIRRHLTTELESLVQPARLSLEQELYGSRPPSSGRKDKYTVGSLGRNFSRSYTGGLQGSSSGKSESRRASLRGSLTRALGLKMKQELLHHDAQSPSTPTSRHHVGRATPTSKLAEQRSPQEPNHRRIKSSGDIEATPTTPD